MYNQQTLTRNGQVTDDFLSTSVNHGSAHRHTQYQVFALAAGAIGAATVRATLRSFLQESYVLVFIGSS